MFYNEKTQELNTKSLVLFLIPFFLGIITFFATIEIVSPGERGVVIRAGAIQNRILDEGFHTIWPYVESIKIMDITVQKYISTIGAASKDLQSVTAEIALNYHLDSIKVNDIYQQFRREEIKNFIDPSIKESVKAATAKYTAEELITQRAAVKDAMTLALKERIEPYGFIVDSVSITDFKFSDSFERAIEEKVTAEQNALAEKNRLSQIEYQAQQTIVTAKAEAETIRIKAEAIQNQGGDAYVELKSVEKWNGVLPVYMMPNSSVPFININQ